MQLPTLWYYGVEGGMRPTLTLEASNRFEGMSVYYGVRLNDPDTLALFPYAQGAWAIRISVLAGAAD